jgi:hypothetical protein
MSKICHLLMNETDQVETVYWTTNTYRNVLWEFLKSLILRKLKQYVYSLQNGTIFNVWKIKQELWWTVKTCDGWLSKHRFQLILPKTNSYATMLNISFKAYKNFGIRKIGTEATAMSRSTKHLHFKNWMPGINNYCIQIIVAAIQ